MIHLNNRIEYPLIFFSILRAGLVALPTSTMLTEHELEALVLNSGANLIVTEKCFEHKFVALSIKKYNIEDLNELKAKASTTPLKKTLAEDPAYMIYSSGTTAAPKGIIHSHRSLLGRLPASKYWFNYHDDETVLHSGDLNWTYTLGAGLMDPLYQKKTVVFYSGKKSAKKWIELINQNKVTTFISVPTIFRQILEQQKGDIKFQTLRHCMSAGEKLAETIQEQWQKQFGLNIYEGLGMSECSYYLSHCKQFTIKKGTSGKIQPGHQIDILDQHHNKVGPNQEGMIAISTADPGLFLRYQNTNLLESENYIDNYFLTGDYARVDEEGYVTFLGRKDDIINSFGYRVSPLEIESVLKRHKEIKDCIVVGKEISKNTNILKAFLIPSDADLNNYSLIEKAKTLCHNELAKYKHPREYQLVSDFKRTKNGKVIRGSLLELN